VAGKSKNPGRMWFSYPMAALVGTGVMGVLLLALSWVNERRAEAELAELKGTLCASKELGSGLSVTDDTNPTSWQAWAIVDAVLAKHAEQRLDVRVLQRSNHGWKQWQRWSREPEWVQDAEFEEVSQSGKCEGAIRNGNVRIVRSLHTPAGTPALVVVERKRQ
jgi:hypothetical protein